MSLVCFASVLDELQPFKYLRVTADSIQSETNFEVSKLSKNRPSILMRIIWSMLSSPNLVCSTDFTVHARKTMFTNGSIATVYPHNFKQNSNQSLPLWQTNSFAHQLLVMPRVFPEILAIFL